MAYYFAPTRENRGYLTEAGLGRFAHVPYLLSDELDYLDEVNRFLRERAWGFWTPQEGTVSLYAKRTILSENTIKAYGRDLENFWTYMEVRGLAWKGLSYVDVLKSYDTDMASGACTRHWQLQHRLHAPP